MHKFSHLADNALLQELAATVVLDRATTARLIALIAETDARRLYAPAGYSSMHAYCVGVLKFSDDMAAKRIQAARVAQRQAVILEMLADGRLNLSGVCLLAPHLAPGKADELLAAAAHKTNTQIAELLAQHFPRPDLPTFVQATPMLVASAPAAPEMLSASPGIACETRELHAVRHVLPPAPPAKLTPLAPQRYALQVTLGREEHDFLRHAQDLLGRGTAASEVSQVLTKALELYVRHLQKARFAATARPGRSRRSSNPRQIPAEVRRRVWERDRGRCTFVSESGHKCESRTHLELDHVTPIARGGTSTPSNLRLRCRAHNQYEARRIYGSNFMQVKLDAAPAGRTGWSSP